eukprot:CAMPEP_0179252218 /NCGR_PEP_ID=MMETSP0797-20121207/22100_1 /TAXON_ID=47934 /ORGANISM="Dinophysis acuminata, Strain DAEP01" /LENGTH=299 /DNA_ID=CAMNT_0020960039 /DNA_START=56 /DNA_END=956 /DNA_ORIENTATION=+
MVAAVGNDVGLVITVISRPVVLVVGPNLPVQFELLEQVRLRDTVTTQWRPSLYATDDPMVVAKCEPANESMMSDNDDGDARGEVQADGRATGPRIASDTQSNAPTWSAVAANGSWPTETTTWTYKPMHNKKWWRQCGASTPTLTRKPMQSKKQWRQSEAPFKSVHDKRRLRQCEASTTTRTWQPVATCNAFAALASDTHCNYMRESDVNIGNVIDSAVLVDFSNDMNESDVNIVDVIESAVLADFNNDERAASTMLTSVSEERATQSTANEKRKMLAKLLRRKMSGSDIHAYSAAEVSE